MSTMNTWLELLPLELNEITDYFEPELEFDPNKYYQVGKMTESLKKLFTLWRNLDKEAERSLLNTRYGKNEQERKSYKTKTAELKEKAKAARLIFWISLKDTFGLWDKKCVGVTKGFLVIWSDEERPDFLGLLFETMGD